MKKFEISEFCGYAVDVEIEKNESYGIFTLCYSLSSYAEKTKRFSDDFYECRFGNDLRGRVLSSVNNSIRFIYGEAFQQMILGYYAQFKDDGVRAFTPENGEEVIVKVPIDIFEN